MRLRRSAACMQHHASPRVAGTPPTRLLGRTVCKSGAWLHAAKRRTSCHWCTTCSRCEPARMLCRCAGRGAQRDAGPGRGAGLALHVCAAAGGSRRGRRRLWQRGVVLCGRQREELCARRGDGRLPDAGRGARKAQEKRAARVSGHPYITQPFHSASDPLIVMVVCRSVTLLAGTCAVRQGPRRAASCAIAR